MSYYSLDMRNETCAAVYFVLLNIRNSLIAMSGLGIYHMRVVPGIDVLLSNYVHDDDDDGVLIFRVDSLFRAFTLSPCSTIMRNVYYLTPYVLMVTTV